MSVTAPPRPPRSSGPGNDRDQPIDREELEAIVEALIEEARQRARRRRRRNGACILLAVLAGGGLYFGLDHVGGGTGAAPAAMASAGDAAAAARSGSERWGLPHGPEGGPGNTVAVAPSAPETVYLGTGRGVFRSTNGGRSWTSAGLVPHASTDGSSVPGVTSLLVDPRTPSTVYAGLNSQWDGGKWNGGTTYRRARLQDHGRREDLARPRPDRSACRDQSDRASDRLRSSRWTRRNEPSLEERRRRTQLAAGGQRSSFDISLGARVRPDDAGHRLRRDGPAWDLREQRRRREVARGARLSGVPGRDCDRGRPAPPADRLRRNRPWSDQEPRRRPQLAHCERGDGGTRPGPRLHAGDCAPRRQSRLTDRVCDAPTAPVSSRAATVATAGPRRTRASSRTAAGRTLSHSTRRRRGSSTRPIGFAACSRASTAVHGGTRRTKVSV